jgi:predicted nucleic acid-binding protein
MAARYPLAVALDSNVLFDLADGKEFAATALEVLRENEAKVFVPPTVFIELLYEVEHCTSPEKGKRAERALDGVRAWNVKPISLTPTKLAIAKEFSNHLRDLRLLPNSEFHDGCILAEAALWPVAFLLTSDEHLLSIDRESLQKCFDERQLARVEIVSPRGFYNRVKRR